MHFQTVDFDFNSIKRDEIKGHLSRYGVPTIQNLKVIKPNDAQFNKEAGWLQAYTTYETPEGRGKGFLRLKESAPGAGDWQAFTFFTALWEIKGHEENAGHKRPLGAEHGVHESSENWLDRRQKQLKFENEDPTCLIVGGGQNGLMLAARLTTLGVKTLIVEKNPRIGDSWRRCVTALSLPLSHAADSFRLAHRRYHTLCMCRLRRYLPTLADGLSANSQVFTTRFGPTIVRPFSRSFCSNRAILPFRSNARRSSTVTSRLHAVPQDLANVSHGKR